MKELFNNMLNGYNKSDERRKKLEKEMNEYDKQLQDVRDQVSESMKELMDLQTSIGNIKMEQENQKNEINKLISIKKKLQDEISKHQIILQRYQKIRERLKVDQTVEKGGQAAGPYPGSGMSAKNIDDKQNPPIYNI